MSVPRQLVLATLAVILAVLPAAADETRATKITYVTESSVYVESGTDDGLNVGDKVEILQGDKTVAVLEVTYAATHKSVCGRIASDVKLAVGDTARFTPRFPHGPMVAAQGPPALGGPVAPSPPAPPPPHRLGLRGRVGLRYFWVKQSDAGLEYRQPMLDLRVDGTHVLGSAFDLGVDMRARRTYRSFENGNSTSEGRNRLYSAFVAWRPNDSPLRVALGRQFSPSLGGVSIFDGALVEYRKSGFAAGAFLGNPPDPVSFAHSSEIREEGAFVEFGSPIGAPRRWVLTTGAVTSTSHGEVNRDYLYVQGFYDNRSLSLYGLGEADVNRGWRKEAEGKTWSLTSGTVSARYRFGESFSVDGGFDDRRSVRIYRDYISPETEFDDRYRRGTWAGFDGRAGTHFGYGVNARRSDDGNGNKADSYTLSLRFIRLTAWGLDVRTRSTHYTSEHLKGWLHSVNASAAITDRSQFGAYVGTRNETALDLFVQQGRLNWIGVDYDIVFTRHWMFILNLEKNSGQNESNQQMFATVTYRF